MKKNVNKATSDESVEDLLQQLKNSQGPGDALISIGGQGPVEITTQHGTTRFGGDSATEDVDQEVIQKAFEEVVELGKKQIDLEFKYGRKILMRALMRADKEVWEYHQQKASELSANDSLEEDKGE